MIIKQLYWNQTAAVRTENLLTTRIDIQKGVRQGCVLSPLLFNLYSDIIFQNALEDAIEGIKINGEVINNLRYADDTAIIAESADDLEQLLARLNREGQRLGMKINTTKTKIMVISKQGYIPTNIHIDGHQIEQVRKFKYLGCHITDDLDPESEIKVRIEQARSTFVKMKKFFANRDIDLKIRYRMIKCYIYSVLLYGTETWTLKAKSVKRLEAFEMWLMRRMLKISWTDHITNNEVLQRFQKDRELLTIIKRRKTAYFGHILRNKKYKLLQLIMKGKIEGKRGVGRKRISWLRNIKNWTGMNTQQLFRVAEDREAFDIVVANLR